MHNEPTNVATLIAVIKERIFAFLAVFFVVFTLAYLLLSAFGLVPAAALSQAGADDTKFVTEAVGSSTDSKDAGLTDDATSVTPAPSENVPASTTAAPAELPVSITIDALDRTVPINNPTSRAIADLDAALLTGVVRHPDSALPGGDGTVFILGHSSYLPQVRNHFFQAFNGIQNLTWGDTIRLTSNNTVYVYQVDNVYKANATDVSVPIANTGPRLTLATCNSFGSKDDRYIVEAKLIYSEPVTR